MQTQTNNNYFLRTQTHAYVRKFKHNNNRYSTEYNNEYLQQN